MSRVLLLGAGLVAPPLVDYLVERGIWLTIACNNPERGEALLRGRPVGAVLDWAASDAEGLDRMVAHSDLVVSLLPASMHVEVAEACIHRRKHLVTTSYVSPEMRALDPRAKKAGVVLLNELGVDPGIDHMSAMEVIHRAQRDGARVTSFRSYCGGIPAPEANDNPFGYKFSWSPVGVLRAATRPARFLDGGKLVERAAHELVREVHPLELPGVGTLEAYPNRDATDYLSLYGLDGIATMYRGTLRYPGWTETMQALRLLGLLENDPPAARHWDQLLAARLGLPDPSGLASQLAAFLSLPPAAPVIERLRWLGLLSPRALPRHAPTVVEALAGLMQEELAYRPGERDLLVMQHRFELERGARRERIVSSLVCFGESGGDSAMARTVGLPAAIGARLLLEGRFTTPGVHIPVLQGLYEPILAELATLGIALTETHEELVA